MNRFNFNPQQGAKKWGIILFFGLSLIIWIGCVDNQKMSTEPGEDQINVLSINSESSFSIVDLEDREFTLNKENVQVQAAIAAQESCIDSLLALAEVVGVGTGMTEDSSSLSIVVMTMSEMGNQLPDSLNSLPVVEMVTGEITALNATASLGKRGSGNMVGQDVDPTTKLPRPVPIGVSGGHFSVSGGTIGCRVRSSEDDDDDDEDDDDVSIFALSTNSVFAANNAASIGDNILQPSLFDGGQNPQDAIATLADFEPIEFSPTANNIMNAAIALTSVDSLNKFTPPDGYGKPKKNSVEASIGMKVRKYGRSSRLTKSKVEAINVTVEVNFSAGVARFVNQIVISKKKFSTFGDSGALIVAKKSPNKRKPVALLFALGEGVTIASPIQPILDRFGVKIDGPGNSGGED